MTDTADAFSYAFHGGPKYRCPKCGKRESEFKDNECLKCTMDGIEASVFTATGIPPGMGNTTSYGSATGQSYRREAVEEMMRRGFGGTFYDAPRPDPFEDLFTDEMRKKRERARAERFERAKQQAAPPPPPPKASKFDLDAEMLRRLIQLCHPDKHANSLASQKATHFLLDIKAALDKAK